MKLIVMFMTLTAITFLSGCAPTAVMLTGKYQDVPYEIKSNMSFDLVWSNLIDFFAQKGISIKIIDKSSGLIQSEKTSFLKSYTTEADGKPQNPNAWIVLNDVKWMGSSVAPQHVFGEWNVRLKATADGGTIINVNLTNIDATAHFDATQYTAERNIVFDAKSTGKFESFIAESIK